MIVKALLAGFVLVRLPLDNVALVLFAFKPLTLRGFKVA